MRDENFMNKKNQRFFIILL